MSISSSTVSAMGQLSVIGLRDWLVRGFVAPLQNPEIIDAFAPHSFVHNFLEPEEAIIALFSASADIGKRALQKAVLGLLLVCRPDNPEYADLTNTNRHTLLKQALILITGCNCTNAAMPMAEIACGYLEHWSEVNAEQDVFDRTLLCMNRLAVNLSAASLSVGRQRNAKDIEQATLQLGQSVLMSDRQAPIVLRTLLYSCPPKNFLGYVRLMGPKITQMHQDDLTQVELASLTANFIIQRGLAFLKNEFNELQFAIPHEINPDKWLLDALFGANGPLFFDRSHNSTSALAGFKNGSPVVIRLQSEQFRFYLPPPAAYRSEPALPTAAARKAEEIGEQRQFGTSRERIWQASERRSNQAHPRNSQSENPGIQGRRGADSQKLIAVAIPKDFNIEQLTVQFRASYEYETVSP